MKLFSSSLIEEEQISERSEFESVVTLKAAEIPANHPAEPDIFARHSGIPGHDQEALLHARVGLVGAGGLNSWAALGLIRSGVRRLLIIDHDLIDRTNLPRQLYYADDRGKNKAICLARNLLGHATAGAEITAVGMRFEDSIELLALPVDLLVVGVDNNAARLAVSQYARQKGIAAVFTMLSRDSMRCHCFLQGPESSAPCLWCALPNLDPEKNSPCASAIISSCFLAVSATLYFCHRAIMGWPDNSEPFNWKEMDLMGIVPEKVGRIRKRKACKVCGAIENLPLN